MFLKMYIPAPYKKLEEFLVRGRDIHPWRPNTITVSTIGAIAALTSWFFDGII